MPRDTDLNTEKRLLSLRTTAAELALVLPIVMRLLLR